MAQALPGQQHQALPEAPGKPKELVWQVEYPVPGAHRPSPPTHSGPGAPGPQRRSRAAPVGRVFRCGLAGPGTLRPRVPAHRCPPHPARPPPRIPTKGRAGHVAGRGREWAGREPAAGSGAGGAWALTCAAAAGSGCARADPSGALAAPAGQPGGFPAGRDRPREREEAAAAAAARGRERAGGGAAAAASRRKEEARTRAPLATRETCSASRARASRTQPPPRSSARGGALRATRPARPRSGSTHSYLS